MLKAELRIAETQVKDVQIEVLEGLKPDDQVVLSDMSAWDEFDRVASTEREKGLRR